ncbi:MAG: acylneuraminate cytidylyltransferase family protein [Candidatus Omnitrophica bacterium]|nr:acylneuraminate cytidylyltransferase family protein [Candidatus Omnitrophota bacterium]
MKVLCVIPARGGSKTVPKKNLVEIGGKSLLYYAAECVKNSKVIERTVLSTDSGEIAAQARSLGLEVPFMRSAELATDETTDWPVFNHCMEWLKDNDRYVPDIVVHLRVTSPFAFKMHGGPTGDFSRNWICVKREEIIDGVVNMLAERPELDSVRTVELVRSTPYKMWRMEGGVIKPVIRTSEKEIYNQPRQKIPPAYLQNGYVDAARYSTIMRKKSMNGETIGGYVLDCDYFVDIDGYADIELGDLIYRQLMEEESVDEYKR